MVNVIEGGKGIPTVPFGVPEAQFGDGVVVPGGRISIFEQLFAGEGCKRGS
jgi:hypothetical protein